jgi:hypothetical protein
METTTKNPELDVIPVEDQTGTGCTCDPCTCDPCECGSTETAPEGTKVNLKNIAIAVAGIAAAAATFYAVIRPWHLTWGATDEEVNEALPGDHLIPSASTITHAVTIDAPVDCVWPWLAELGHNKGDAYKFSWLENVISEAETPSGEHPAWQDLKVGDAVQIHTNYPPAPVVDIKTLNYLVLGLALGDDKAVTWSFVLREFKDKDSGSAHTRLIVRFREPAKNGIAKAIGIVATEPIQFVIERKLMLTIKKMAEDLYQTKQTELARG